MDESCQQDIPVDLDGAVTVEIDGERRWQRTNRKGQPEGISIRDRDTLAKVVALLSEGLSQAKAELSLLEGMAE